MTEARTAVDMSDEFNRRRRARSIAIGLALAGLSAIFYAVTLVKGVGGLMH